MDSPPSRPAESQPREQSSRPARLERTRLDLFPRGPAFRWIARVVYAIPFVVVALIGAGTPTPGTVNAQLVARVAAIDWARADARWVAEIFPPISTLIAAITPGGVLGLAILGALIAGILVQKIIELMVQRRVPWSTTVILVLALAANPVFAFAATQNLPGFLGLAFCGLGLAHLVRFVMWSNTQSGFRAGILFLAAALSDASGPLYVATAAVAAPFLNIGRKGQRGARWANVLVIVYPTAAALGTLMLLNWVFLGNPLGVLGRQEFQGILARTEIFTTVFTSTHGLILIAPVVSAWVIALIVKSPGAIVVSALVFVAQLAAYVLGLVPESSRGNTVILMMLLAISLIPTARTRTSTVLVDLVAIVQIGIAWVAAFDQPLIVEWMRAVSLLH